MVTGLGSPARPPATDVATGDVEVVGATDEEVDVLARNALADLETFWAEQFPEVFGADFQPLQGGYFSVDPGNADPADYPRGIGCGAAASDVESNAFYCIAPDAPNSDSISYDRAFLADLGAEFGRFIPALVMAHEFGHAVQARVGSPSASIAVETQADCLAGTWTRWVAEGEAEHSVLRTPELDELLRGYLQLRDPVGHAARARSRRTAPTSTGSPPSRRASTAAPRPAATTSAPAAVFTQHPRSTTDEDVDQRRERAPGRAAGRSSRPRCRAPGSRPSTRSSGNRSTRRRSSRSTGTRPAARRTRTSTSSTAPTRTSSASTRPTWPSPAYELGDFAVATAVALPYGLAVRDQLGLSTDDEEAARSAVCLSGWYAARVFAGRGRGGAGSHPGTSTRACSSCSPSATSRRWSPPPTSPASSWSTCSAPASSRASTPAGS